MFFSLSSAADGYSVVIDF